MCLKMDQTEGRIIFVEKTISCFTFPVPSEYITVQAAGREGKEACKAFLYMDVGWFGN